MKKYLVLIGWMIALLLSCNIDNQSSQSNARHQHRLHIPAEGIESMMEAGSQKIIEGTQGSVLIKVGHVSRNEADITIMHNQDIVCEKLVKENSRIAFDYADARYTLAVGKIKKPLIGEGKVAIRIYE